MNTRDVIVQNIIVHEVLTKRKSVLDQFREGFEALGFDVVLQSFPDEMEPLLVMQHKQNCLPTASKVIALLRLEEPTNPVHAETFQHLQDYIQVKVE